MNDLKKDLSGVKLIGCEGLWSSSLDLNELKKILPINTKKYDIGPKRDIVLFLGHADIRNTKPIYEEIEAKVDKYVELATKYLNPYFQNVYFAEPWPMWSDSHPDKLNAEDHFKKALAVAVQKYNTRIVITQKEIYEAIGKYAVTSEENVKEKHGKGLTWPDEYFEKVLNLIIEKSLTL
jgi:ADP-heptose:LPS heptosyltransferase